MNSNNSQQVGGQIDYNDLHGAAGRTNSSAVLANSFNPGVVAISNELIPFVGVITSPPKRYQVKLIGRCTRTQWDRVKVLLNEFGACSETKFGTNFVWMSVIYEDEVAAMQAVACFHGRTMNFYDSLVGIITIRAYLIELPPKLCEQDQEAVHANIDGVPQTTTSTIEDSATVGFLYDFFKQEVDSV